MDRPLMLAFFLTAWKPKGGGTECMADGPDLGGRGRLIGMDRLVGCVCVYMVSSFVHTLQLPQRRLQTFPVLVASFPQPLCHLSPNDSQFLHDRQLGAVKLRVEQKVKQSSPDICLPVLKEGTES